MDCGVQTRRYSGIPCIHNDQVRLKKGLLGRRDGKMKAAQSHSWEKKNRDMGQKHLGESKVGVR